MVTNLSNPIQWRISWVYYIWSERIFGKRSTDCIYGAWITWMLQPIIQFIFWPWQMEVLTTLIFTYYPAPLYSFHIVYSSPLTKSRKLSPALKTFQSSFYRRVVETDRNVFLKEKNPKTSSFQAGNSLPYCRTLYLESVFKTAEAAVEYRFLFPWKYDGLHYRGRFLNKRVAKAAGDEFISIALPICKTVAPRGGTKGGTGGGGCWKPIRPLLT